jgi:hypothetical protein
MAINRERLLRCSLAALMVCLLPFALVEGRPAHSGTASAEETTTAEKEAFEAAKALGTIEAWDAFLSNHSKGFYADLARAYVKKLTGTATPQSATPNEPAAAAATPTPSPPSTAETEAEELACAEAKDVKSERSDKAVKLRFVNESEGTIIIQWIDFNGALKEYAQLQPGKELVQDTFMTHPWIAAYQEGSCRQLFRPGGDVSVARLLPEKEIEHNGEEADAPAPSGAAASAPAPTRKAYVSPYQKCRNIGKVYNGSTCVSRYAKPSKATVERRAKASCVELGMIYLNGKCAPKTKAERKSADKNKNKACPAGMYRNPYGKCQPNETGG